MERGEDYWRVQSARRRDFWKRCLEANVERNAYDSVYAKAFCTVRCGRGAPKELKYYDPDTNLVVKRSVAISLCRYLGHF